jgi:hypothetical protein
MSLEFFEMHVHDSSPHRLHDRDTPSACILVLWSLTTSLTSSPLVGRELVSTTLLLTASLDIGGFLTSTLDLQLSSGGAYLLLVRLRTLILEYDKRVAYS